ncbi:hypothetical protein C0Q91_28085 [Streptomyces albidoflavus]|uniref:Uncharacterized protein n=1 Tax=Streptomyces albidoflavus TaxID=1886 RepID=A0AB37X6L5_9ACTN|nr:hypothetical protein B9S66_02935 [Streptomyces sp. SM17]RZE32965.1 hypothetical protein C0Q91_28085 [Streptomyces albidoflavus]
MRGWTPARRTGLCPSALLPARAGVDPTSACRRRRTAAGPRAHAERCCGVPLRPAELKGAHSHTHRCPRLSGRGQRVRGHGGTVSRGVGPGGRSGGGWAGWAWSGRRGLWGGRC